MSLWHTLTTYLQPQLWRWLLQQRLDRWRADWALLLERETIRQKRRLIECYDTLQQQRRERAELVLPPKRRPFLRLVPLYWHCNHPGLPGFIDRRGMPTGIYRFTPDEELLQLAHQQHPLFEYLSPLLPRFGALFEVNGAGTLTQTAEHRFRFWICHEAALIEQELLWLQYKADALQQFAEHQRLQAEFILINSNKVAAGLLNPLYPWLDGSSALLLMRDTLYHNALQLAGQIPLWWLIAPEQEGEYQPSRESLALKHFDWCREVIDLGPLPQVAAGDFFAVALQLLQRGVAEPYSHLIELQRVEFYLFQQPLVDYLSHQLKRELVLNGSPSTIDPWQQLSDALLGQDGSRMATEEWQMVRQALFLQLNWTGVSAHYQPQWRLSALAKWQQQWQLSASERQQLQRYANWPLSALLRERQLLYRYFYRQLQRLLSLAKERDDIEHSRIELSLLQRQLTTIMQLREGKVLWLGRGVPHLPQPHSLLLQEQPSPRDRRPQWQLLSVPLVTEGEGGDITLCLQRQNLVELVSWCSFNHLNQGPVALQRQRVRVTEKQLNQLLQRQQRGFRDWLDYQPKGSDFRVREQPLVSQLVINFGLTAEDQPEGLSTEGGEPLLHGDSATSLFRSLDWVSLTNWGEIACRHYHGEQGLADWVCDYLRLYPLSGALHPPLPQLLTLGPDCHSSMNGAFTQWFNAIVELFYVAKNRFFSRLIWQQGQHYYLFYIDKGQQVGYHCGSWTALLLQLQQPLSHFTTSRYVPNTTTEPLALIVTLNRPQLVQAFGWQTAGEFKLWVADERGSYYYLHEKIAAHPEEQWRRYQRLLQALVVQQQRLVKRKVVRSAPRRVAWYRLELSQGELDWVATPLNIGIQRQSRPQLQLQLQGEGVVLRFKSERLAESEYGERLAGELVARWRRHCAQAPQISAVVVGGSYLRRYAAKRLQTVRLLRYYHHWQSRLDAI
ncbi:hypothetical protein D5085_09880 [Ectothiorhodospiraceae bacterium BW-2]|nr:hypothetical protein D5085_09880 [Ectothiorhodospiraceae bacterium BW-2]